MVVSQTLSWSAAVCEFCRKHAGVSSHCSSLLLPAPLCCFWTSPKFPPPRRKAFHKLLWPLSHIFALPLSPSAFYRSSAQTEWAEKKNTLPKKETTIFFGRQRMPPISSAIKRWFKLHRPQVFAYNCRVFGFRLFIVWCTCSFLFKKRIIKLLPSLILIFISLFCEKIGSSNGNKTYPWRLRRCL